MNFLSIAFLLFIISFFVIYQVVPQKHKYILIFVGSYIFYGYANLKMLFILFLITVLTYIGGLVIHQFRNSGIYGIFFFLNILVLLIFKYTNFAITNINLLFSKMNYKPVPQPAILLPVGLSFIIFQSSTYLSDVYKGKIEPERNFLRYGAFVAFFPTVLSGPIQKARNLLPQIAAPRAFEYEEAQKGVILFAWGAFEKIVVANKLQTIVNTVFLNYKDYNSAYYIIAAFGFSLYIYADFASYSDMARGIARILGIDVGKNFNNPYLSVTTSEFWNRWHMSLNSWFVENIYIPLGGNRKGTARKYFNVMVVFFVSGLWHGADYHFIAWGVVNGLLVVAGQLIAPYKSKIYRAIKVDEKSEGIILIKRAIVFCLITMTWVFFNNGIHESLYILRQMISVDPIEFFDLKLLELGGSTMATLITLLMTVLFCYVQVKRVKEHEMYELYQRQAFLLQCIPMVILVCICIFSACSTGNNVNAQFLYFQF